MSYVSLWETSHEQERYYNAVYVARNFILDHVNLKYGFIALGNVKQHHRKEELLYYARLVARNMNALYHKLNGEVVPFVHSNVMGLLKALLKKENIIINGKAVLVRKIIDCEQVNSGETGESKFLSGIIGLAKTVVLAPVREIEYHYIPIILSLSLNSQSLNLRLATV